MSVTAILIEPHRVTRVIFDGHDLAVGDQQRIAQAIECSLARADGEAAADDQHRHQTGRHLCSACCAR
jgi:hypothetical protein